MAIMSVNHYTLHSYKEPHEPHPLPFCIYFVCVGMQFHLSTELAWSAWLKVTMTRSVWNSVWGCCGLLLGFFPDCYDKCPSFMRHKMTMISPTILKQYSIPFNKVRWLEVGVLCHVLPSCSWGRWCRRSVTLSSPFPMATTLVSTTASTVRSPLILLPWGG